MVRKIGNVEYIDRDLGYYEYLENSETRKKLLTPKDIISYNAQYIMLKNEIDLKDIVLTKGAKAYIDKFKRDIVNNSNIFMYAYVDSYLCNMKEYKYKYMCNQCGDVTYINDIDTIAKRRKLCYSCYNQKVKKESFNKE